MAHPPESPESEDSAADLRGTLAKRLAVAGVLVALLLGMLAFFDYLATAPEEPEVPVFTKPVPVAPKKEVSQPVTPVENLPAPPVVAPEPVVEPPPPPTVEAPSPAVVTAKPEVRQENRPLAPSTAAHSKVPASAAPVLPPRAPRIVPEASEAPSIAPAGETVVHPPATTPTKPPARVLEIRPAPGVVTPSAPRLFSGFLLQAGVFYSAQRAEELHAKLTLSGVPSTLETRVQVGPFRTRQEAEAAQAKLKELGVETILVPPKGGRP